MNQKKKMNKINDDTISRQAAICMIEEYSDRLQIVNWEENPGVPYKVHALNWAINTIQDLPSAERRGRWIDGKRMRFDGTFHWFRQCSECLYERKDDNSEKDTNYCPNCGAFMRGEEE